MNIPSTSCSPFLILIYFPLLFSRAFSLFSGRFSSIHHINGNKIDLNCFQNKNTRTIYILVLDHRVNLVLVESYQSIMHCHINNHSNVIIIILKKSALYSGDCEGPWTSCLFCSDKLWPWVYIDNVNFFSFCFKKALQ